MKLYTITKLLLLFLLINACASNNVDQSEEEPKPISVATDFDNKPSKKILERQNHFIPWMKQFKIFKIKLAI